MSPDDVVPHEMGADRHIGDAEVERFLGDLRSSFPAQAPATSETHLAAMFETAHLLADNGDPVARPVSNADAPAAQVSRLPKRRRNTMTERNFRARALRIAAPTIAAFTVLGAMAAANAKDFGGFEIGGRVEGEPPGEPSVSRAASVCDSPRKVPSAVPCPPMSPPICSVKPNMTRMHRFFW